MERRAYFYNAKNAAKLEVEIWDNGQFVSRMSLTVKNGKRAARQLCNHMGFTPYNF